MIFVIYFSIGFGLAGSTSPVSSHCFRRISSGERLIGYDVTRIIERDSVGECEEECNEYKCTFFSFGNVTGNGTCELTTDREISRTQDSSFDLYERTEECAEGKPTGYEKACYRRIITGKRLHERFIRHSLPCNSLQACQHQCSIEKHFTCQGFNIRLDPVGVGRGICELSSVLVTRLDPNRDFVFDPEFAYYERDHDNGLPNCGLYNAVPNAIPSHNPEENPIGYRPPTIGGPYYGGDSYGPWSTGHGTVDHGPWGSHGYGSGFYESNNPSRGPAPSFHPDTPLQQGGYGYGFGYGFQGVGGPHGSRQPYPPPPKTDNEFNPPRGPGSIFYPVTPAQPGYGLQPQDGPFFRPHNQPGYGYGYGYGYNYGYGYSYGRPKLPPGKPAWGQSPSSKYPNWDRKYDRPHRIPTYIIIDADVNSRRPDYQPPKPSGGYLPVKPPVLPPPRPPPQLPPPHPPPGAPPPGAPPPGAPPPHSIYPRPPSGFEISREVCFRREHPGYKLNPDTIRGMYETSTVLECEAMCVNSPFKCTGYSFRYSSPGRGPNCLLTDYTSLNPETHLLPDRSCDVYLKMGTCMEFDRMASTECFLKVATNRKLDPGKIVMRLTVTGMSDCELACLSTGFFTCRSFSFRHGPPVIGEPVENCFLSDWPVSALAHSDFVPLGNHEVYERGSFGHGCELDAGPTHIGPRPSFTPYPNIPQITHVKDSWGVGETWRHFTVNGWPCRAGTQCELNPEVGFWACEVEGGDKAQWDYCCRPKHSCGFSRGYHYPWCYVGEAGPDQWRPCSEFYYPEFSNRYPYRPVHPVEPQSPPRDTGPWNFGPEEFGPPSYWPISYIYAEPPPNETYIWDPEEQIFYHDHDEHDLPPDYHHHDGPRIRFKPCGKRHPYPRAIIQKLDLKNIPKAGNPEEQSKKDERPRGHKTKAESENRDKKHSEEFFPSVSPNLTNLTEGASNGTNARAKEVIKEVEKIIMENSTGTEPEKNESLKKVETKHSGFFSVSLLENSEFWN